jgi:hypothetical protein
VLDGFVPLPRPAGDFAQNKLCGSAVGIDLQLLAQLGARLLGGLRRRGPVEKNARDAEMNLRQFGVLLEDFSVRRLGFIPAMLRFQGFGVKLGDLVGIGGGLDQLADGTLVATPDLPSEAMLPSLLTLSDAITSRSRLEVREQ